MSNVVHPDSHNGPNGYPVRSLYFDSLSNRDFQEKEDGLELRRKFRLRVYSPDADFALFEMKQKQGPYQRKRSLRLSRREAQALVEGDYSVLLNSGSEFGQECHSIMEMWAYRPKTVVEYDRFAFIAPENSIRITFDSGIRANEVNFNMFDRNLVLNSVMSPFATVLEVKYNGFLLSYIKHMVIQYEDGSFISVKYDASDVYLYLHKKDFDLEKDTLYVPVDTTPKTGSTRMENCTAEFERPTDFVLILNGKDNTRLLVQDRYNPIHANYEEDITGEDPYIDPPAKDSAVFENICMVLRDVIGQYQDAATPLKTFESGKLYYGNGNPSASAYDSRADFICNGDDVEIRIPWQLLNFSDPSRMQIHDDYYDGNYGIEAVEIKEMFIGLGSEGNTIEMGCLKLKGWENTVSYHERLKEAYQVLKTYWTGKEYE